MRASFLLALVPAVAFADASPPTNAGAVVAPSMIEYAQSNDGKVTAAVYLKSGGRKSVRFAELPPYSFVVGGQKTTVSFGEDFKIHVRAGGNELILDAAGQGYLSQKGGNVSAELVENVAPVPLVKVGSHPEACADFWDVYVSVVDGVPRQALALYGLADPPSMSSSTVKFGGDGALVTTRTAEDDAGATRTKRTRYRWSGSVYVEAAGSKRASTRSK